MTHSRDRNIIETSIVYYDNSCTTEIGYTAGKKLSIFDFDCPYLSKG